VALLLRSPVSEEWVTAERCHGTTSPMSPPRPPRCSLGTRSCGRACVLGIWSSGGDSTACGDVGQPGHPQPSLASSPGTPARCVPWAGVSGCCRGWQRRRGPGKSPVPCPQGKSWVQSGGGSGSRGGSAHPAWILQGARRAGLGCWQQVLCPQGPQELCSAPALSPAQAAGAVSQQLTPSPQGRDILGLPSVCRAQRITQPWHPGFRHPNHLPAPPSSGCPSSSSGYGCLSQKL